MSDKNQKLSVLEKHGFSGLSRWPNKIKIKSHENIDDFFLHGYLPTAPFISKEMAITAFGSCFAGNVSRYMSEKGYKVNAHNWKHAKSDFIRIDEIMVHTPALLAQFEWAFNNVELGSIFVGGKETTAQTYHTEREVKELITSSDVYIITLGLTEAWYDKEQEQYLWKFVPRKSLDSNRYINKSVNYQENLENIEKIYKIIRSNCPDSEIIFTLSPIPLLGTYSSKSILCANTVSKAKLRAALDAFMDNHQQDEKLHYFPSYELVLNYLDDPWEDDNRHITKEAIQTIMDIFGEKYLKN
ncbi:MAG: GSCFA domain-containing protein [Porticoccaceae bacterium]